MIKTEKTVPPTKNEEEDTRGDYQGEGREEEAPDCEDGERDNGVVRYCESQGEDV